MTGYYYQKKASYREYYSGYNSQGRHQNNTRCWQSSCTYYVKINNESYDENNTYIKLIEDFINKELEIRSKVKDNVYTIGEIN